jgi:hypothetical protein
MYGMAVNLVNFMMTLVQPILSTIDQFHISSLLTPQFAANPRCEQTSSPEEWVHAQPPCSHAPLPPRGWGQL